MFEKEHLDNIQKFFSTYPGYAQIERFRTLRSSVGTVKNIFYGDSVTAGWPLHEFFPNHSILNRGIGGDSVYGLYSRLEDDVFAYSPKRVFMLVGINGINEPEDRITAHILALAQMMRDRNIQVGLSTILPLRATENHDERVRYQDKIVKINGMLKHAAGADPKLLFLDYHAALRDPTGQLAAECAQEDGLHITFEAYRRMAQVVRPHLSE
jgi:lysophospholipase L1-like esterase